MSRAAMSLSIMGVLCYVCSSLAHFGVLRSVVFPFSPVDAESSSMAGAVAICLCTVALPLAVLVSAVALIRGPRPGRTKHLAAAALALAFLPVMDVVVMTGVLCFTTPSWKKMRPQAGSRHRALPGLQDHLKKAQERKTSADSLLPAVDAAVQPDAEAGPAALPALKSEVKEVEARLARTLDNGNAQGEAARPSRKEALSQQELETLERLAEKLDEIHKATEAKGEKP